ncbi:hypothetical protein PMAYCL1PPCAC_22973 [Pristionchus mayeri]|uniref:Uncharacterized protein n=1 Tax=Pristionchus mayeri TaxID=1317129 RepID=A0AAN5CXR7_9BILA|nr:hypothetical protein PMAYCL1PPCAC_22973 [Pristionchus mayeri]
MVNEKEVFQSITTYKIVLRKMAMTFPKYDHIFDLHSSADYGRQSGDTPEIKDEVRELDYGRAVVDTVTKPRNRIVLSSVKLIAFALSAVAIAIIFESTFHIW